MNLQSAKYKIFLVFVLSWVHSSFAENFSPHSTGSIQSMPDMVEAKEFIVNFPMNETEVVHGYADNDVTLRQITECINNFVLSVNDTAQDFIQISLRGGASPEGSYEDNSLLSKLRQRAVEQYIRSHIYQRAKLVVQTGEYIDWDLLKHAIAKSNMRDRYKIGDILIQPERIVGYYDDKTVDSRVPKLQKLSEGRAWQYMKENIFPLLRSVSVTVFLPYQFDDKLEYDKKVNAIRDQFETDAQITSMTQPVFTSTNPQKTDTMSCVSDESTPIIQTEKSSFVSRLLIETNVLRWILGQVNAGLEFEVAPHWSLAVSGVYCGWDYFKTTLKFKNAVIRPAVNYWFSPKNKGWRVGAHVGITWFNFGFGGDYGYQNHVESIPAFGGGIDIGYRLSVSRNGRWFIDFGLSGGVYSVDYDKYTNTPTKRLIEHKKFTYLGLDDATVAICYRFSKRK